VIFDSRKCKFVHGGLVSALNVMVWFCSQMAQLARACTQENPHVRPSMRSIVVALMTLSSSTEDWDVGSLYENQAIVDLMSGR
jgi:hypothetical protein